MINIISESEISMYFYKLIEKFATESEIFFKNCFHEP